MQNGVVEKTILYKIDKDKLLYNIENNAIVKRSAKST